MPGELTFDERVAQKMEEYSVYLEGSEGLARKMIENILYEYCYIDVQLDEVKAKVRKDGTTIINNKGNVVRNPDIMTQHQLVNEKNALLPKILKYAQTASAGQSDELLDFVRG